MKSYNIITLVFTFAVAFTILAITDADHCPPNSKAVPNNSAPNHSSESSESASGSDEKGCGPNKVFLDCASVCPRTCNDWWVDIRCQACKPGCACKDDLVLNDRNECVPIKKCPKPECTDPNREFIEHGSPCPEACPGVNDNKDCTSKSIPGCFCKTGLVEDGNGNCIDRHCCPPPACEDPNREYLSCGSACPPSCANLNETSVPCTKQCVSDCFCKYPLVEDGNKNCIKPSMCPPPVCSDPNRHFESCGTACPKTCRNLDTLILCTDDCVSGCFCNDGLVEDDNRKCVKPEDCPPSCSGYMKEWSDCGPLNPPTCENYRDENYSPGNDCVPGCFCASGYVEDQYGNCIDPSECPTCSDPNKEFLVCGSACPPTCDNYKQNIFCTDQCVSGCFCKKGLVADGDKCVKPENCGKCKDPKQYFDECGTACPRTCNNYYKYDQIVCTEQCVQGCFCRNEYVLDKKGNCIDPSECPTPVCDDPKRVFNPCGSSCPDSCKNINEPDRVCTLQCVSDCFCRYPLVESGNGTCIERTKCPNPTCADPKKYYKECGTKCPLTCKNRCKEFSCTESCVKGCFCLPWLIDDGCGKCIDPKECPKDACKCEGNAEWTDCGTCDGTCKNPYPICAQVCRQGCFCPNGYVRDNKGVCILQSNCPKASK